jgi:hypothetical protein
LNYNSFFERAFSRIPDKESRQKRMGDLHSAYGRQLNLS